ncbi:MAG TPA: hypothetical protein VFB25_02010 [Gaiellaceae bacterium]|nr:hypothetical protein [Gaiellaceae bacterium]
MSALELDLSDAHRRWVSAVTQHMRDVIEELRRCGATKLQLAELKGSLTSFEDAVGVVRSQPPFLFEAFLTRLWVDACELNADSVEHYGALGERERRFFNKQAQMLERCIERLREAVNLPTL